MNLVCQENVSTYIEPRLSGWAMTCQASTPQGQMFRIQSYTIYRGQHEKGNVRWQAFENPSNLCEVRQAGHWPWVGVGFGKPQTEMRKTDPVDGSVFKTGDASLTSEPVVHPDSTSGLVYEPRFNVQAQLIGYDIEICTQEDAEVIIRLGFPFNVKGIWCSKYLAASVQVHVHLEVRIPKSFMLPLRMLILLLLRTVIPAKP